MTTYLVTRHPGTRLWAQTMAKHGRLPFAIDQMIEHLDVDRLVKGDVVVGTLPVHVAAALHARKVAFWSLDLDVPPEQRGKELSGLQLIAYGARLTRYEVKEKERHDVTGKRANKRAATKPQPSITLIPVSDQLAPAAIGWLHQPTEQVALLASPSMGKNAKQLKAWLDERESAPTTRIMQWDDGSYAELLLQADRIASALSVEDRPQVVINLTGGTKPMSMALQRAFGKHRDQLGHALRGAYVDTQHQVIADMLAETPTSTPMRSVLNIHDMLVLQGLRIVSASSARTGFATWMKRDDLFGIFLNQKSSSAWLGAWYQILGEADWLVNPRKNRSGKRSNTSKDGIRLEWNGKRNTPQFIIDMSTCKPKKINWKGLKLTLEGKFGAELKRSGCCDFSLVDDTLTLNFDCTAMDELAFASGAWMEAWLAAKFSKEDVDEWASGLFFETDEVKNEFDLVALCGNRLLVAEVKTANLTREGHEDNKATEIVYKLDSLAEKLGRYFNERWLISLKPLDSNHLKRAHHHGIRVFHGGPTSDKARNLSELPAAIRNWRKRCALERDSAFTESTYPNP